jgi:hypothetical protein
VRKKIKDWVIVVSLLVWQLGSVVSAAPLETAVSDSDAVPCHGMNMTVDVQVSHVAPHHGALGNEPPANLPPCCAQHSCQGDCMHSPALTLPVILIAQALRDHPRVPALCETFVDARVAELFRPPI